MHKGDNDLYMIIIVLLIIIGKKRYKFIMNIIGRVYRTYKTTFN